MIIDNPIVCSDIPTTRPSSNNSVTVTYAQMTIWPAKAQTVIVAVSQNQVKVYYNIRIISPVIEQSSWKLWPYIPMYYVIYFVCSYGKILGVDTLHFAIKSLK